MDNNLSKRLFNFSVSIILAIRKLPNKTEYQIIIRQLIKSSTSVGANYEEAQAGVSKADFANKIGISLKEIRESNYWIRIIINIDTQTNEWYNLETESEELMKILESIYSKVSKQR
nr:four helix bundle protein [uncultured Carboxylicivirga sp.]